MRGLSIALTLLLLSSTSSAAGVASTTCRAWRQAAFAKYEGEEHPTYQLYLKGQRWIIGEALLQPNIPAESALGERITARLNNHEPLAAARYLNEGLVQLALDFCKQHPSLTLSQAVELLGTKALTLHRAFNRAAERGRCLVRQ